MMLRPNCSSGPFTLFLYAFFFYFALFSLLLFSLVLALSCYFVTPENNFSMMPFVTFFLVVNEKSFRNNMFRLHFTSLHLLTFAILVTLFEE